MTTTCSCRCLTSTEAQYRCRDEAPWSTTTPCQLVFLPEGRNMGDHARDTVGQKNRHSFSMSLVKVRISSAPGVAGLLHFRFSKTAEEGFHSTIVRGIFVCGLSKIYPPESGRSKFHCRFLYPLRATPSFVDLAVSYSSCASKLTKGNSWFVLLPPLKLTSPHVPESKA
jgi:hypothetical protein